MFAIFSKVFSDIVFLPQDKDDDIALLVFLVPLAPRTGFIRQSLYLRGTYPDSDLYILV